MLNQHGYEIAPSTYYATKARGASAAYLQDPYLANTLRNLFELNRGLYGIRKQWSPLHPHHPELPKSEKIRSAAPSDQPISTNSRGQT
ncbi:hypothetical protein [Georgenia sp. AZ-5]|uniref:hypothetical protein n=1 Tax=Georgenia sp. AZ-5 TaxID=3367526 RepID=UPI0037541EAC